MPWETLDLGRGRGKYPAMRRYRNKTPEEVIKMVSIEMIERGIRFSRKTGRTIRISKTSGGAGVDVRTLDPRTAEGRANLEAFFRTVKRHYTISGLGAPEEKNSINWRKFNLPLWRRIPLQIQVGISLFLKGVPAKNAFLRRMGAHIGRNTEIMQFVWLDHFRPELIFIGDNTVIGAYSRLTVHVYEGRGRVTYGLVQIGDNCMIGAGTGMGAIRIEDNVRTLPGTTLSPYFTRIRAGSVVGWNPPPIRRPATESDKGDSGNPPENTESREGGSAPP
jgi:acetyltransferase-like isoleucine patch superfamily enzyme